MQSPDAEKKERNSFGWLIKVAGIIYFPSRLTSGLLKKSQRGFVFNRKASLREDELSPRGEGCLSPGQGPLSSSDRHGPRVRSHAGHSECTHIGRRQFLPSKNSNPGMTVNCQRCPCKGKMSLIHSDWEAGALLRGKRNCRRLRRLGLCALQSIHH